jgi:sensor c-di-GMP phosphodiesterase-like protein
MSALVSAFIAGRHQRLLLAALWGTLLSILLGMGYGFIVWQVSSSIRRDQDTELGRLAEIRGNVVFALQKLQQDATAPPCSPGRTAAFTQMVADRAYEELGRHIPRDMRLEINFNVFACDLDSARLLRIFSRFLEGKRQFDLAVELVESQEIDFEEAQRTIQELARAGVRTYIDDFGTGYSSIERVATLAVHGVKLDRSFAMSPPDSIMGQMLVQVLEMIKASGRMIVVEGVETEARHMLRSIGIVDGVQGYVISRPLGIDQFIAFLGKDTTAWRARDFAA